MPIGFSKRKLLLDFFLFWTLLGLLVRRRYAVVHAVEEAVFMALPFTLLGVRLVDGVLPEPGTDGAAVHEAVLRARGMGLVDEGGA